MSYWAFGWAPRKSVAARRADAARMIKNAARNGQPMSPVTIEGRKIAQTFWGKAWCDNLERYRDFAYRLERGRSYVRSGSVIHLEIAAGKIAAKVSGSSLYDVAIEIAAVSRDAWRAVQRDCAGGIGSRIDLLGGRLSEPVMARLCAERTGLFPDPSAIQFTCSCPDYALMCKHVAAVMYGVGARLDTAPELLFTLRRVSADDLIASALSELPAAPAKARVLADDGLAALFGIELAGEPAAEPPSRRRTSSRRAAPRVAAPVDKQPAAGTRATKATNERAAAAKPTHAARRPTEPPPTAPAAKQTPAAKRSAAKQRATKATNKPAAEQPAAKQPATKATNKPAAKQTPAAKQPATKRRR